MHKTAIIYIGTKHFTDRLYNTGLAFEPKQVRQIPDDKARLFLRHSDLFAKYDSQGDKSDESLEEVVELETPDDTEKLLDEQADKNDKKAKDENNLQDLYTQVMVMDKDALEQFAKEHYQHNLDKRKSVDNLRNEVVGLIDQFGVV